MSMTPTPDPPPAAPLTAEQIAAIEKRCDEATEGPWSTYGAFVYAYTRSPSEHNYIIRVKPDKAEYDDPQAEADAAFIAHARTNIPALLASHAALRDRLARAEERVADLEGALRAVGNSGTVGYGLPGCPFCGCDMGEPHDEECVIAVALTTPTDGAARAGDAAGDKGGTP